MRSTIIFAFIVLIILAATSLTQASETNWMFYVQSDSPNNEDFGVSAQVGVKPTTTDGLDPADGEPVNFQTTMFNTKWTVNVLAGDIYSKNYLSTADWSTYPGGSKKWHLRVAGLTDAPLNGIRLRFKTGTSTATLAPAATVQMKYWVRLLDDRGHTINKPAWAGGGVWSPGTALQLTVPSATNSYFGEISLPDLRLSGVGNPQMLTEGYAFDFIQGTVPEPTSVLAFAIGIMALVVLAGKYRRMPGLGRQMR